jgi:sn-glycerol 3-phosphate transport system permease protein
MSLTAPPQTPTPTTGTGNADDPTAGTAGHAAEPSAAAPRSTRSRKRSRVTGPVLSHTGEPITSRPVTPQKRKRVLRDSLLFLALILPNLAAIVIFSYWPAIYSIVLSFMDWDLVDPFPEWVGAENYVDLFTDPEFGQIMLNTLLFTGVSVVGSLIAGVALGALLSSKVPFTGFVRTFAFAPHMIPGAAVGMLWLFMFDPGYGLTRAVFEAVGMQTPEWTTTSAWSLWAVTLAYLWQRTGFVAIIYYTAILDLPQDLYEAAALDGAHGFSLFRYITFPLLGPITFFLSVTGVISAAQSFDLISILTSGGPGISSTTLSWMIYDEAFQKFDIGRASAAATVMLAMLLLLTYFQLRFSDKKVNYAS